MICTPVGMRVEPDVYCRYAIVSASTSTCCQVAPTSTGTASTAMTRGRSLAGRLRKNLRTPSAASVVVRIADRLAVVEHGVQAADVAGLGRVEQRYRDAARVERAEERDEVLEVLRAQDGDPVTGFGDLLQPGADRPVAGAELRPVQLARRRRRVRREKSRNR